MPRRKLTTRERVKKFRKKDPFMSSIEIGKKLGLNSRGIRRIIASEEELINKISDLNDDPIYHGILVQLPLPNHINTEKSWKSLERYYLSTKHKIYDNDAPRSGLYDPMSEIFRPYLKYVSLFFS